MTTKHIFPQGQFKVIKRRNIFNFSNLNYTLSKICYKSWHVVYYLKIIQTAAKLLRSLSIS